MTRDSAHNHIRIVSLLTLVSGILGMIPTLILLMTALGVGIFGSFSSNPIEMLTAGGILGFIAVCLLMLGLPALIAGFGLLARKSWARPLTLVIAVFSLFAFPIGTLLAIYQFWVLAINDESVAAYKSEQLGGTVRDYA